MAPSVRVKAAFQAMENIGIPKNKTKPALKKLLKLFDKNWDLIEEENYRVLADTIFEFEDNEAAEKEKQVPTNTNQGDILGEAARMQDEPERPLKRLRLKHQDQAMPSHTQPSPSSSAFVLKIPKPEPGEPEVPPSQPPLSVSRSPLSNVDGRNTESQPTLSQPPVRDKGKQPISPIPHVALRNKSPATQRASQGILIKEPKPEPGLDADGKQKQPHPFALITPKDEPFTDDMVSVQPLAVVPPEPPCPEPSIQCGNPLNSQDGKEPVTSKSVNGTDKCVEAIASVTSKENHLKESDGPCIAPTNIDIASSPLGEVKICLCCNRGPKGQHVPVPNLEAVLKEVEDNCVKRYKVMNPEFSLKKLMTEICECALELRAKDDGVTQEKASPQDSIVRKEVTCSLSSPLNGSINAESSNKVATLGVNNLKEFSDPPTASNCLEIGTCCDKSDSHNDIGETDSCIVVGGGSKSLGTVRQHLNADNMECLFDPSDITKGKEKVKVSLEILNSESLPSFHYISQNVISQNADVMFSLGQIGQKDYCLSCHGDCSSLSPSCNCVIRNGGESPYTSDGLVREEFLDECISIVRSPQKHCLTYCKVCPLERSKNEDMLDPCKGHLKRKFIKECWTKCGCSKYCGNRVVQQGITCNVQVFWAGEGKGWGLRTLEELPKGAFVCEYVGEILTIGEFHKRNLKRSSEKHSYSALLDSEWGSRALKESELLSLDATFYGNIARFINHRCSDASLIEIPIEVETPNHHYYHIALFTTRKVEAFEELTWDYGLDFDDNEQHIKAFRCLCGSDFCRDMKRSSRSRTALASC